MQNYEKKSADIEQRFRELAGSGRDALASRLTLSWSSWGFGMERLADSVARLEKFGVEWIELPGNHHGADLGFRPAEVRSILGDAGLQVSGICGLFSADNDLSSNRPIARQAAIDYIRRELDFAAEVGARYLIVVPGAVGRPDPYDSTELERSAETLRSIAPLFEDAGVRAAIEPIRSAEVSFCHTVADAARHIDAVDHPAVAHINGDVYHMQSEEAHIGTAILEAGGRLANVHLADSNRDALGGGSLDLDTVIRALYLVGHNGDDRFVTPEPLGPGGDPYPALYGLPDPERLDALVGDSVRYFREREDAVRGGAGLS